MKRILLSLLLAWVAIAPAFANACAADCEGRNIAASIVGDRSDAASLKEPDCHGAASDDGEPADPHGPGNANMVASCFFAAAALMSGPAPLCLIVDVAVQRSTSVLISPTSITPAPPEKPPQA